MGLFVDTTGSNVDIQELGITLVHPITDYDLSGKFSPDDLRDAGSLTAAILAGDLNWKKTSGGTIEPNAEYDADIVDIDNENLGPGKQDDRSVTFKDLGHSHEWGDFPSRVVFSQSPHINGVLWWLGWYLETDTAQAVTSAVPYTSVEKFYHSHLVMDVGGANGLPFTVRVTGMSVDETTGNTTAGDTEDISVTANGYYQTSKTWIDEPELSIVEASKEFEANIYRTSYWDQGNTDFNVFGMRLEFQPDSQNWEIDVKLSKLNNDGSLTLIDQNTYAFNDAVLRADKDKPGGHKRLDYDIDVLGSEHEGLILEVNQTGMKHIFYELKLGGA